MFYDASYMLLIPAILFTLYAQSQVNKNFDRYSRIRNRRRITGAEAARRVLDANGLTYVRIEEINGNLSDHYDPRDCVLRLSPDVYERESIAAVSVACHEVGHALQHAEGYVPLRFRNTIVPLVNFASKLSWPLILVGIILLSSESWMLGDTLFNVGVIAFLAVILFHAVTLPVEFNASNRALAELEDLNLLDEEEEDGAVRVLRAAALTYVAALATAVMNLIRLLAIRGRRD